MKKADFPNIGAVMASNQVIKENYKPLYVFREKPSESLEDSGWRIFSGYEDEEYCDNPDNFGYYDVQTLLDTDPTLSQILLKGIGTIWERENPNSEWVQVFDEPLEDDFLVEYQFKKWNFVINNLFVEIEEDNSEELALTTGDKTLRLSIWNNNGKSQREVFQNWRENIEEKSKSEDIIKKFNFEQDNVIKLGYQIKEYDKEKDYYYNLICGFSISEEEMLMNFFYFDDDNDLEWAINTWESIEFNI